MKIFKHWKHFDFSSLTIYKEILTKCLLITDKTGYRDADASKNVDMGQKQNFSQKRAVHS